MHILVGLNDNWDFPFLRVFLFVYFRVHFFAWWSCVCLLSGFSLFGLLLFLLFFVWKRCLRCVVFISMFVFLRVEYAFSGGMVMGAFSCARDGQMALGRGCQK